MSRHSPGGGCRIRLRRADFSSVNQSPLAFDTDDKLAERHQTAMNKTALCNINPQLRASAARVYRARPDGGPSIRALEGSVWDIPKLEVGCAV